MKNVYLLIAISLMLLTVPGALFAQGVAINTDGAAAHASAMLDVQSYKPCQWIAYLSNRQPARVLFL